MKTSSHLDTLEEALEFAGFNPSEMINDYLKHVRKHVIRPFGNRKRLILLEELLEFTKFSPEKIRKDYIKNHRPPEEKRILVDNRLYDDCTAEQIEKLRYYESLRG